MRPLIAIVVLAFCAPSVDAGINLLAGCRRCQLRTVVSAPVTVKTEITAAAVETVVAPIRTRSLCAGGVCKARSVTRVRPLRAWRPFAGTRVVSRVWVR